MKFGAFLAVRQPFVSISKKLEKNLDSTRMSTKDEIIILKVSLDYFHSISQECSTIGL